VRVINTTFTECLAAFSGGGLFVGSPKGSVVSNFQVVLQLSTFARCTGGAGDGTYGDGGGFGGYINGPMTNSSYAATNCTFYQNRATAGAGGFGQGGGFMVVHHGALATSFSFTACVFLDNTAAASGDGGLGHGGGFVVAYESLAAIDALLTVTSCDFIGNNAGNSNGIYGQGGGFEAYYGVACTRAAIVVVSCHFKNNTATAGGDGLANGGGVEVLHYGGTDAGSSVVITACSFIENKVVASEGGAQVSPYSGSIKSQAYGGAVEVEYVISVPTSSMVLVTASKFIRNTASGDSGKGGAVYIRAQQSGCFVTVTRCTFTANMASDYGGALYATLETQPAPTNLVMHAHFDGAIYVPQYSCFANYSGVEHAREWDEASTTLTINTSEFISNQVGRHEPAIQSSGSQVVQQAFGGAIHVGNFKTEVHSCSIHGNQAFGQNTAGAGIALGAGTASLNIGGNSSIHNNSCSGYNGAGGGRGTAIYSASGGAIKLRDSALVQLDSGEGGFGMTILNGGRLEYDEGTKVQCAAGQQLEYNVTQQAESYVDWSIDCSMVRSDENGTTKYMQPTCEQLRIQTKSASALGPLFTHECNYMPLQPEMLLTTGTVSCSRCAPSLYSLDVSSKRGSNEPHALACLACPYGADCSDGGNELRVKAGFWGHAIRVPIASSSTEGPSADGNVSQAEVKLCPAGYCCSDDDNGCAWDGDQACQGHRSRGYPMCGGCKQGFSQAIDRTACVINSECGSHSSTVYALLQLGFWCALASYGLWQARFPPVVALFPKVGSQCSH
jgi:hypothetical protein